MATYTHGHHSSVLRSHSSRDISNSAEYLRPHLTPSTRLLDVGAGPGSITVDFAGVVARVTATEIDENALGLSRGLAESRGVANIDFSVEDVHALSFADDSFDVVHAHQVLQHVGDPVQALREMRRVTVPGGVVAARDADYAGFHWFPMLPELDRWLDLYRRGAGQRRRAGRRATSAVVGARRRLRRRHGDGIHLVLREPRGPGVVGWHVGRPHPGIRADRSAARQRHGDRRGAARHQ